MLSLQCAITRDLIDNSDPGYTRLKQQLEKNMKIDFVSPPTNSSRNEKKKTKSR